MYNARTSGVSGCYLKISLICISIFTKRISSNYSFFRIIIFFKSKIMSDKKFPSYLQKIFQYYFSFSILENLLVILKLSPINLRYRNLNWHFNPVIYNQRGIGQTFLNNDHLWMKSCSNSPVSKNTPASIICSILFQVKIW